MADFYIRSAKALDRVLRDECSVKAAAAPHPDAGRVLAILINSLAYRSALMLALEESKVLKLEERTFTLAPPPPKENNKGKPNPEMPKKDLSKPTNQKKKAGDYPSREAFLLVLCHDLLFQSRGIQAAKTWPPKVTLERYKPSLHSSLVKLQIRQGKNRIQDLRSGALYQEMTARIPRWIRINPLRATREQVLAWLAENRYVQVEGELNGIKEYAESQHVPGLLAFHPKATSHLLSSEMYKGNWIVMQDLASCFPAYILDPPNEAEVVDATSAPGNKTSHLSAIMYSKHEDAETGNDGKVYAFERDAIRYKTLVKRLTAVGALHSPNSKATARGNVVPERKDFLTTQPIHFPNVTHMLLDPSCSGSGIVNRLDFLKEDDDVEDSPSTDDSPSSPSSSSSTSLSSNANQDATAGMTKLEKRLHQLAEFQLLMIRHAFKYPSLRKIVYSTCSIHFTENENVVIRALDTPEAVENGWRLAPRSSVIPSWPVRGDKAACKKLGKAEVADQVIRCIPGGTGDGDKPNVESCNGFFVACFVKDDHASHAAEPADTNKGPNKRRAPDEDEEEVEDGENETAAVNTGERVLEEGAAKGANTAANRKKKLQKRRKKQRSQLDQQQ